MENENIKEPVSPLENKAKRSKKPKVKQLLKKENKTATPKDLLFIGVSLFISIIVFFALIFIQNTYSKQIVYKDVVVAIQEIPKGKIITDENKSEYFGIGHINILNVPENVIDKETFDKIVDRKAIVDISKNTPISESYFKKLNHYTDDIENPIEVSVSISSLGDADGGKLRAGDIVNITMTYTKEQLTSTTEENINYNTEQLAEQNPDQVVEQNTEPEINNTLKENVPVNSGNYEYSKLSQYVLNDVYIEKALDSSGVILDSSDMTSNASILIFKIDKTDEEALNNALSNCSNLRISKVVDK